MTLAVSVCRRVAAGRAVAAADPPAGLAHPQVHPHSVCQPQDRHCC